MKLIADLHTHSKHSRFFHGKNSVLEMAFRANELGLREFAITDHAFKHVFRTNKDKLYDARLTIDDLNQIFKTKLLLGIEADILDEEGNLDVDAETFALIDILIVGYHRMIKTDFAGFFGGQKDTPEAIEKATNAFINAINKYPVTIVSHLDSVLKTDLYKIGKACADKGVLVEINNRHTNWTKEQADALIQSECMFIVSSDAHNRNDVGNVSHALELIKKYNIPSERIANVEFDFDEMSDEHKELNILYEELKRKEGKVGKVKTDEMSYDSDEKYSRTQISDEMERELQKIAKEQGYRYTKPKVRTTEDIEVKAKKAKNPDENYETEEFLDAINSFSDSLGGGSGEVKPDETPKAEEVKKVSDSKPGSGSESNKKSKSSLNKKTGKGTFVDISGLTKGDDKD